MIVSNQLSTHQNYSNMQSYDYKTLYLPVSSGNRLYTHVDGSIRIQEKPLGYVIGERLLHAAKKLDTIILSLVVPSFPGANALQPRVKEKHLLDAQLNKGVGSLLLEIFKMRERDKQKRLLHAQLDRRNEEKRLLDAELNRRNEEKQMSNTTATSSTTNKKLSTYPQTQACKDTQQKEKDQYRVYAIVSSATAGIFAVSAIVIAAYKIIKSKMCRGKQNSLNNLEEERISFINQPPPPLPIPMDLIPSETLK